MQQSCQDALAMVRTLGKPDLFITFACNPHWKEIAVELAPAESAADRPDLAARAFHIRLRMLMEDLMVHDVLVHCVGAVHVVEFQKRGLPHAHMLAEQEKLRTTEDYDSIIAAEIPALYEKMTRHMFHFCGEGFWTKMVSAPNVFHGLSASTLRQRRMAIRGIAGATTRGGEV